MKRMTKTQRAIYEGFRCVDCDTNTHDTHEYYMVQFELWDQFGVPTGMLCIGCLETRMGRRLVRADFLECPVNDDEALVLRSPRLSERLGYFATSQSGDLAA